MKAFYIIITVLCLSRSIVANGEEMKDKGYFLEVGEKGRERLDILNRLTNPSSQSFLKKIGIKTGMHVLEIGCGSGEMSIWLAKQVAPKGRVIATDNSSEQIELAKKLAKKEGVKNIEFYTISAYDIDSLKLHNKLDLVYSRFVFIHLVEHEKVLKKIKDTLKPEKGIVVTQDLIVNHIFSYPESEPIQKWLNLALKIYKHYNKDPDMGKRLVKLYNEAGLSIIDYEYNHSLLKNENEKLQMVRGTLESKNFILANNLADEKYVNELISKLKEEAKKDDMIVSFMPNMIVAGRK